MATTASFGPVSESRAGPSGSRRPAAAAPMTPTGNAIVDIAAKLGPLGETYEEEYNKLVAYLQRDGDVLGPLAPVIFANAVRKLYQLAIDATNDPAMVPYEKCVLLFHVFDTIVLAYKNIGFVYSDVRGARSVYGYSESVLKTLLSRVEAIAGKVAAAVNDNYSLAMLNEVVASAEQSLSQVRSEKDMIEFFRTISSGGSVSDFPSDGVARAANAQLPLGIEKYKDPYADVDTLFRRLNKYASDRDYIRDFHDAIYLLATANAPDTLSGALETRLADKDRNIVLLDVPSDRTFASTLCASAIGYLRKTLERTKDLTGTGGLGSPTDNILTFRINYGRVFSKYRGESERNFSRVMDWIKNAVRGGDKFHVFWFPDIENLMAPRTSNDQEHIATIKNAMLQHMDDFNKDKTLRSFLLLFNSSEGMLDGAFSRRLETVIRMPVNPLIDSAVATQAVSAELARYRINTSDETAARVAGLAATESVVRDEASHRTSTATRIGGFAYVQATLRDMYVNQKLTLKYDAVAVNVANVSEETLQTVFGRYVLPAGGTADSEPAEILYDLDGRAIVDVSTVATVAFARESKFASRFDSANIVPVRYNSSVHGDPKNISKHDAARTVFLHDL